VRSSTEQFDRSQRLKARILLRCNKKNLIIKLKSISFWSEYFKIVLIAQASIGLVGIGQLRQKHT
jgi:hypothetical protein